MKRKFPIKIVIFTSIITLAFVALLYGLITNQSIFSFLSSTKIHKLSVTATHLTKAIDIDKGISYLERLVNLVVLVVPVVYLIRDHKQKKRQIHIDKK